MTDTITKHAILSFSVITNLLFGEWNITLSILIICMFLDFITGIFKAIKENSLNSTVARWGIYNKFLMFIPIILSNLSDILLNTGNKLVGTCVLFYIASESISILENLVLLGVKFPKQLIDVLEKISGDKNNEFEEKKGNELFKNTEKQKHSKNKKKE